MRPDTPPVSTLKSSVIAEKNSNREVSASDQGSAPNGHGPIDIKVNSPAPSPMDTYVAERRAAEGPQDPVTTPPVARNAPPSTADLIEAAAPVVEAIHKRLADQGSGTAAPGPLLSTSPPPERVEKAGNLFDSRPAGDADFDTFDPVKALVELPASPTVTFFEDETLVKADKLTLVISAEKDGKLRLNASSWDNGKVILPGEELDVRWQGGQVVLVRRKPKAPV